MSSPPQGGCFASVMEFEAMTPTSVERSDARPDQRHQSPQSLDHAADERWEDEGGARNSGGAHEGARRAASVAIEEANLPNLPESHPFRAR